MYRTINASPIACFLRTIVPTEYDREEYVSASDINHIVDYLNICMCSKHSVLDISDISVLNIDFNNTSYFLTTDDSHVACDDGDDDCIIIKNMECFFVVCFAGSCKVTVNLGDRRIVDTIKERNGFLMDVDLRHVLWSDTNAELLVLKCTLNSSMFYTQNMIISPEENILTQFGGVNFILYNIVINDEAIKLLITNNVIYDFTTGNRYDILAIKDILMHHLLAPVIPMSEYEFTLTDMAVVKSVNIDKILRYTNPRLDVSCNHGSHFQTKVIYGTIVY